MTSKTSPTDLKCALRASLEDFVAVGEGGGLLQHGGDGAVFFFAQLDGVLDRGFVQPAAEAIEELELGPHGGRVGSALAGSDDFERIEFLPLLFENDDDVGGGAGAKGDEEKLHRAGSFVRFAVGIESDRVARRADAEELLFANPFHGCGLHRETSEERGKDSRRGKKGWKVEGLQVGGGRRSRESARLRANVASGKQSRDRQNSAVPCEEVPPTPGVLCKECGIA